MRDYGSILSSVPKGLSTDVHSHILDLIEEAYYLGKRERKETDLKHVQDLIGLLMI